MAELKTNKKAFDTEVKIYKSLRKLLLEKSINEITVADIANDCGVSRSSFYRNFKSIPDVLEATLAWYYKRYLDNRRSQVNQFNYFFQYWINHRDLVTIVSEIDIKLIKNCIVKYDPKAIENEIILDIRTSIVVSLLSYWSRHKNLTTEEMIALARNNSDKKIFELLIM